MKYAAYTTAPFVKIEDLKKGLYILNNADYDYVFSVTSYDYPIQRLFVYLLKME